MNLKILDCTLRDGGYYTDWNFSSEFYKKYLKLVSKLPIEFIELGYLSKKDDLNGPFYHISKELLKDAKNLLSKNQKILCMINFKEINSLDDLIDIVKDKKNLIYGVRFAVDPLNIENYSKLLNKFKKQFPEINIFTNIMYANNWFKDDKRITFMIKKCKDFSSYISFVDSYGAFEMQDTISFFKKIKKKFPEINSGCHFHNNCGLALANSILAFNEGVNLVDATFGGFGRGAGNAETEMFLVNAFNSKLKLSGFFYDKFIDEINKMKSEMQWGASFIYGYAAKTGVSQAYIMDLIQKKRLTTSEAIDDVKKTKKNKNLAKEKISFLGDQNFNFLKKKQIIILGASESLKYEIFYLIQKYPKKVLVLSGKNALENLIESKVKFKNDLCLVLTGSEYSKIMDSKLLTKNILNRLKIVIAENKFLFSSNKFNKRIKLIRSNTDGINPLLLFGYVMIKLKKKNIDTAFFNADDFSPKGKIIKDETMKAIYELQDKGLQIRSITKTHLKIKFKNIWND